MLASLSIRDIVLIDRLDLDLSAGLCVLTGETGAGKSILLDALGLATGSRADKGLVRHGVSEGSATAVFDVPLGHPALLRLNEAELMAEGETAVILRRAQRADGPSRAFINDRPVSVGLLQEIGGLLLEVHGQNDARGLLDARGHRALLDSFGRLEAELRAVRKAFAALDSARAALETQRQRIADAERDTDYLTHIIEELEDLDPEEGEEDQLAAQRTRAMNAEKITDDLKAAAAALQDDDGLEGKAGAALRRLERIAEQAGGTLDPAIEALSRLLDDAAEAQRHLDRALSDMQFDQDELDRIEERLFALRAAARKHSCRVDQLPRVLAEAQEKLNAVHSGAERVAELEAAVVAAEAAYDTAAQTLSEKRLGAAAKLDKAVAKELKPLKLDKARFRTRITATDGGPQGIDRVAFEVSTNPGAPFGALTEVASGGEMSRFVLALKVALAEVGTAPTLIFDEIDQGVGGAVADAIGERLAQLATHAGAQVIVVTHSPQVAARAGTQWRISKSAKKGQALTRVETLDRSARREEIARMLSAADITDEARAAADRLLDQSGRKARKA
jgi:DNA repair protein RecN (Recombination protein N)